MHSPTLWVGHYDVLVLLSCMDVSVELTTNTLSRIDVQAAVGYLMFGDTVLPQVSYAARAFFVNTACSQLQFVHQLLCSHNPIG
jgi:hypothetical protein